LGPGRGIQQLRSELFNAGSFCLWQLSGESLKPLEFSMMVFASILISTPLESLVAIGLARSKLDP
jgi:hypothetical protein